MNFRFCFLYFHYKFLHIILIMFWLYFFEVLTTFIHTVFVSSLYGFCNFFVNFFYFLFVNLLLCSCLCTLLLYLNARIFSIIHFCFPCCSEFLIHFLGLYVFHFYCFSLIQMYTLVNFFFVSDFFSFSKLGLLVLLSELFSV